MIKTIVHFALITVLWSVSAMADWRCRCGTIVHVDYPTSCPVCGRNLPDSQPPFTPPGGNVNDGTGLRLGATVYEAGGRVVVSRIDPGTPAEGRLYPNDQLVKAAFRDQQSGQVFRMWINSADDIRTLKYRAGAGTKVALEVYRPTSGVRSFFVMFAPERSEERTYTVNVNGKVEERTRGSSQAMSTIIDDATGEAAAMLNNGGQPAPIGPTQAPLPQRNGGESAGDLLRD